MNAVTTIATAVLAVSIPATIGHFDLGDIVGVITASAIMLVGYLPAEILVFSFSHAMFKMIT